MSPYCNNPSEALSIGSLLERPLIFIFRVLRWTGLGVPFLWTADIYGCCQKQLSQQELKSTTELLERRWVLKCRNLSAAADDWLGHPKCSHCHCLWFRASQFYRKLLPILTLLSSAMFEADRCGINFLCLELSRALNVDWVCTSLWRAFRLSNWRGIFCLWMGCVCLDEGSCIWGTVEWRNYVDWGEFCRWGVFGVVLACRREFIWGGCVPFIITII
jgi:hypothetical protein